MSELRPRVTGTEVEYAVGLRRYGRKYFTPASQNDIDHIANHVTGEYNSSLSYMRNGARCYRDGYCLEYATGEDDSFWGTVANEIAGEQLVTEATAKYVEQSSAQRRLPNSSNDAKAES